MLYFIVKNVHGMILIKLSIFLQDISTPRLPPQYESTGSHVALHDVVHLKLCSCERGYTEVSCIQSSSRSIVGQNTLKVRRPCFPLGLSAFAPRLHICIKLCNLQTFPSLKLLDQFAQDFTWGLLRKWY